MKNLKWIWPTSGGEFIAPESNYNGVCKRLGLSYAVTGSVEISPVQKEHKRFRVLGGRIRKLQYVDENGKGFGFDLPHPSYSPVVVYSITCTN